MYPALKRFLEAAGCSTQVELADFLGIRQSSISDAKKRKSIPADWLITLLRLKRINPEWILTGQGARLLQPADYVGQDEPRCVYIKEVRPPEECTLEQLLKEVVMRVIKA